MKYTNPIVKGFYPDPSVCCVDKTYYMVCSSFQYFPGVPLFESSDLVNWKQIGHVLTRKSQVMLEKINSSGGVFAPTIRYYQGRFYMVTTNDTTRQNFYVYTDDIYGEWSEPIFVEQGGIDPSLYFEDGRAYFISNGCDEDGTEGITQCEIEIATGKKLTPSKNIWSGCGGRYLEGPHMYYINGSYYLMAAEGGTEYGHMVVYARSASVWGPFEAYGKNPVLTNRNRAPYVIQGIGHGDLIQDMYGDWHILSLGFRQIHQWLNFHHLGREVFLTPVTFHEDGWFSAGTDGTTDESYEIKGDFEQKEKSVYTFENTKWELDWCYLRYPHKESYELMQDRLILHGTDLTLDDVDTPTFIGMRQKDFVCKLSCDVVLHAGEAGITCYMAEKEHYEIALRQTDSGYEAILRLNIGGIRHIEATAALPCNKATLRIQADHFKYEFYLLSAEKEILLGSAETKYLSSEVAGGFTGVILALYAVGGTAEFTNYECSYTK